MTGNVSAIILAGGQSRRLGIDKTALRIDGKTLLERTADLLAGICCEVVIVTSTTQPNVQMPARVVSDLIPGKGVLGGIYTGLATIMFPYTVVVGADMPFLNRALLEYLVSLVPQYDAVVPVISGQAEPLHAVYSRVCLEPIKRQLEAQGVPRVVSFFGDVRVRNVAKNEMTPYDPELLSLFNINMPDDLERARTILRARGQDIQ